MHLTTLNLHSGYMFRPHIVDMLPHFPLNTFPCRTSYIRFDLFHLHSNRHYIPYSSRLRLLNTFRPNMLHNLQNLFRHTYRPHIVDMLHLTLLQLLMRLFPSDSLYNLQIPLRTMFLFHMSYMHLPHFDLSNYYMYRHYSSYNSSDLLQSDTFLPDNYYNCFDRCSVDTFRLHNLLPNRCYTSFLPDSLHRLYDRSLHIYRHYTLYMHWLLLQISYLRRMLRMLKLLSDRSCHYMFRPHIAYNCFDLHLSDTFLQDMLHTP